MLKKMIKELIEKHEQLKQKGIRLTNDDLFERNMLLERMMDLRTEKLSEYMEEKAKNEVEEGIRFIELQNETVEVDDKKGEKKLKNKYTVDSAKAVLMQEFYEKRQELKVMKLETDLISNKIAVIPDYIQLGKRFLPIIN